MNAPPPPIDRKGLKNENAAKTTASTTSQKEEKERKEEKEKKDLATLYIALQKKHAAQNLPSYEQLLQHFDIDAIDVEEKHLAREVAKRIFEQLESYRKLIETMLQPDMSVLTMQESEYVTEEQHLTLIEIGRTLMRLDRTLLVAELRNTEEQYARFIADAHTTWCAIQPQLLMIAQHLEKSWQSKRPGKQHQHYLG